jgi:transcriptional activator of cad operon
MRSIESMEYKIGVHKFFPDKRLLVLHQSDECIEKRLDGKQTALLVYFVKSSKQIISRDMLAENVWSGRFVSDHAINTKISELRKLLSDDYKKPRYLKTHHQRGYELVADCEILLPKGIDVELTDVITNEILPRIDVPIRKHIMNKRFWLVIFLLSITFTLLPVLPIMSNQSPLITNKLYKLLPLTTENGQEWSPSISFDNKFLAYSHRKDAYEKWNVVIKNLETSETFTLKDINQDLFSPYISKDNKLFFIKNPSNSCEIWRIDIIKNMSISNAEIFTSCGNLESMSPIEIGSENEWLYFSKAINKSKYQITRVHLDSRLEQTLTVPPDKGFGDYTLALSPNGKTLAFLRSISNIQTELMLLDIETRELKPLRTFNHKIFRLTWGNESKFLNYINQENVLEKLNILTGDLQYVMNFQEKALAPYMTPNNETYIISGDFYRKNIISIESNLDVPYRKETIEVSSSYNDSAPEINSISDSIYFTSDRTGTPQIWESKGKNEVQITSFINGYNYLSDKQISSDGNSLLFLKNQEPYIIDLKSKSISPSLVHFQNSKSPIWSCDTNKILLSSEYNGIWNLYEINLSANISKKLVSDVIGIKADCINSKYYFMRSGDLGVFEISSDFSDIRKSIINEHTLFAKNWKIYGEYFYLLDKGKIKKIHLQTGGEKNIELPTGNYISFTMHKNKIYLSKQEFVETNIKQVVIKDQ